MFVDQINKKLNQKNRLLIESYFEIQEIFEKKYGENVLIFIEIGSFFEIYSIENETQSIGKAKEIAELLNIQLTRKNKSIQETSIKNPMLAGVPNVAFERHLNRLIQEKKYTIALIRQKGEPPKVSRYLSQVLSPGTNFDHLLEKDENFIVSLVFEEHKNSYSIGYSAVDVTTGVTYTTEIHSKYEDPNFALDEVFSLLNTYKTSEIVLTFTSKKINQEHILHYLEIVNNFHYATNSERMRIQFQNELFKEIYQTNSFLSPIEELNLELTPLASESLAILIEFILQHDYQIVQKLNRPEILSSREYLYLGNSASEQLSINSAQKDEFTVLKLIDKTATSMGKRLLKSRLLNPIFNKIELEQRYNLTDRVSPFVSDVGSHLKKIYDLERITRRLKLGRLNPFEINYAFNSLQEVSQLVQFVKTHLIENFTFSETELNDLIGYIESRFELDISAKYNLNNIEENIFQVGTNREIDSLVKNIENNLKYLEQIRLKINQIAIKEFGLKDKQEYVSLGFLEKEGYHLGMTRNRFSNIETDFKQQSVVINSTEYFFKDFFIKKLTNSVKISSELIENISDNIANLKTKLLIIVKEEFIKEQEKISTNYSILLNKVVDFIAKIDVAYSNSLVSQDLNYSRPELIETQHNDKFLQIQQLRHPLIETQESNGIYITNDILLGSHEYIENRDEIDPNILNINEENNLLVNGVLVYGINSSGKSSLMKSVGIAIILAQSGFYVPANKMRFSLFTALFTRIVAKDNLSKGLSSFAVEMLELKNIFNRITEKSIVLGDEISHGTETLSGVSIVSSAIIRLIEKKSFFIFATHLHQLAEMQEIINLKTVVNMHLAVNYDEDLDKLIFDRKLLAGSGSSIYGLEFARSLHMDKKFLDTANSIRKRLAVDYDNVELLMKKRTSKYNQDLYLTKCVICAKNVEDVHHIEPQKNADQNGFIGHFSKDHKYNLIPLCKEHHKMIHDKKLEINGFQMTSTGLELHYSQTKEESNQNQEKPEPKNKKIQNSLFDDFD